MTDVAIVLEGYAPGLAGAEFMAWGTARELAARGHRVALLGRAEPTRSEPTRSAARDWRRVADGADDLPFAPQVVHAFDFGRSEPLPFAAALAARHGAAFVVTPATTAEVWPDPPRAVEALRAAHAVFALTRTEADRLRRELTWPDRVRVVGQAADPPIPKDPAGLAARLGLTGPVVLYLGRRAAFKGWAELLAAVPAVRAAVPEVQFVFAGPPGDEPAPAGPGLLDLGLVDPQTKADLLARCDVLCLPSRADVFPLVFIEAWSLGKVVVSGDFVGARDVVRDGVDGLVVPVEPAAIAQALCTLLADPARRTRMGQCGQDRVRRELTWPALLDRIEPGYRAARQLTGGRR